ncbi:MAG: DUF4340 domain-containing protein [Deltaproteobacteria bacterium]|nr:DUF4340 domain-containing protein [Deltaproteobacteria bacterium]
MNVFLRLGIAASILVAGGLYLWTDFSRQRASSVQSENARVTIRIAPQNVSSIVCASTAGQVAIAKTERGFIDRDAPDITLDPAAFRKLLSAFAQIQVENVITAAEQSAPDSYGFPTLSCDVVHDGGKTTKLVYGAKNPVTGRRFLRVNDQRDIYVVEEVLFEAMNLTPENAHLRTPFRVDVESLRRLEATRRDGTRVAFDRDEAGRWLVTYGAKSFTGDRELLERKVRELKLLKADAFLPSASAPGAEAALERPMVTLGIRTADTSEPEQKISFFEAERNGAREFFARIEGRPTVYKLVRRYHLDFVGPANAFRARLPLGVVGPDEVEHLCWRRWSSAAREPIVALRRSASGSWTSHRSCEETTGGLAIDSVVARRFAAQVLSLPVISYGGDAPLDGVVAAPDPKSLEVAGRREGREIRGGFVELGEVRSGEGSRDTAAPVALRFEGPDGIYDGVVSRAELDVLEGSAATLSEPSPPSEHQMQ